MKPKIILVLGLFAFLATMAAFGQSAEPKLNAKIDFPFTVEGKSLPAGSYTFMRDATADAFRVSGEAKHEAALAQVQTRLAFELHLKSDYAHIVFDKIGDTYALAEIWIPGEDGYVLAMTKGAHTHRVVTVEK